MIFRKWADSLPASIELCPVRLPGREGRARESAYNHLPSLVEAISEGLKPYLDKPFAFFGHSMGAIISYQLTHRVRSEHGLEPAHLFVSGRRAPQVCDNNPPTYKLPDKEFIEDLHRLNGTPREVLENHELMQMMIPLLRADFEICQTYQHIPLPSLRCPITAFGGLQDHDVSRDNLEAWREHTTGTFTLRMLPGDHFFLNSSSALLLRTLATVLHQSVLTLQ
jgi:medium-chain acyl-[acyl-carrier-protein] hydrolase